jgi:hypothetical protein
LHGEEQGRLIAPLSVCFESGADFSLRPSDLGAWMSAYGQKQTPAMQKETRRSGIL